MVISQFASQFDKVIDHLNLELKSIRTNRAAPSILENIPVAVYGSKMPLIQLSSIQSPEPKTLIVEIWDRSIVKDVEKAIQTASLGFSVSNEGTFLRVMIPPMTEETRQEILKALNRRLEDGRQALRGVRDDVKESILKAERAKEISADDKFKLLEDLDQMTRDYNDKIKGIGEKKEEEIKL